MNNVSIYDRQTWLNSFEDGVKRLASAIAVGIGGGGAVQLTTGDWQAAVVTLIASALTGFAVGFFGGIAGLGPERRDELAPVDQDFDDRYMDDGDEEMSVVDLRA